MSTLQAACLLLVADVFYDRKNIPLSETFINDYQDLIIADSRVKPSKLTDMLETARYHSGTMPDLAESRDFNSIGIFRKRQQRAQGLGL